MPSATRPCRTVRFGADPAEVYDVWEPPEPGADAVGTMGTVALVHGGVWVADYDRHQLDALAARLTDAGWHVANIEYLRLGMPGGRWPGIARSLSAGLDAVAADPDLPGPCVAVGHSTGGHLVAWAAGRTGADAAEPGLAGIVSLAGLLDLRRAARSAMLRWSIEQLLEGTPQQVPAAWAEADPARRPLLVPAVLLHGREDDLVPVDQLDGFCTARGPGDASCRAEILDGCEHFGLIDPGHRAYHRVEAAVRELAAG